MAGYVAPISGASRGGLCHFLYGINPDRFARRHKNTIKYSVICQLQKITPEMRQFLADTKAKVDVAIVGGSDLVKILEQMDGTFEQGH